MERDEPYELPMFPLGSVLVPGAALPLHVFEPRYRALVHDVVATEEQELGVVLIARGSEVGGGDVRTDVGTVARVLRAEQLEDGRWGLICGGARRIRVVEWLPDDPYPRALVADWPDEEPAPEVAALLAARRGEATALLRQALALSVELGDPAPPATIEVDDDPIAASSQIAALAPVGPLDRQALLLAPGPAERLDLLVEVLSDAVELQRGRLGM